MVPRERLELSRFYPADFESAASTIPPSGEPAEYATSSVGKLCYLLFRIDLFDAIDEFLNACTIGRSPIGLKLFQRHQHKEPLIHAGMREKKLLRPASDVFNRQNVDVERPRRIVHARRTHAPMRELNCLQEMKEIESLTIPFERRRRIHIFRT